MSEEHNNQRPDSRDGLELRLRMHEENCARQLERIGNGTDHASCTRRAAEVLKLGLRQAVEEWKFDVGQIPLDMFIACLQVGARDLTGMALTAASRNMKPLEVKAAFYNELGHAIQEFMRVGLLPVNADKDEEGGRTGLILPAAHRDHQARIKRRRHH